MGFVVKPFDVLPCSFSSLSLGWFKQYYGVFDVEKEILKIAAANC